MKLSTLKSILLITAISASVIPPRNIISESARAIPKAETETHNHAPAEVVSSHVQLSKRFQYEQMDMFAKSVEPRCDHPVDAHYAPAQDAQRVSNYLLNLDTNDSINDM